jgi:ribonuclease G
VEREILVSADALETRVALLEAGIVVEVALERKSDRSRVGNIYKSKVNRVLPGMQSAFVDIGLERDAFLHVTDFLFTGEAESRSLARIEDLVQEGDTLLVQVVKEAIAGKGARVTRGLSLPGRYLVMVPLSSHVGISRKVSEDEERDRLREIVLGLRRREEGYIVRTAALGQEPEALGEDMTYLADLWQEIGEKAGNTTAPSLLHQDLDRPLQMVRDLFDSSVIRVLVEGRDVHERILDFVAAFAPRSTDKVQRYSDPLPLFEARGVRREIDKALRNKVWLRSGGSIVLNQTEALVAVDVNTGKYTGRHDLEETILKINMEAVQEILRQLRLRDLGGIIVIDFIDMERETSRQALYESLKDELRRDRARTHLHELSDFGLIQITRRRARRSLERTLCRPCPSCHGSGRLRSVATVAGDILMELRRQLADCLLPALRVRAHPRVVAHIEGESDAFMSSLGAAPDFHLELDTDDHLSVETFVVEAV